MKIVFYATRETKNWRSSPRERFSIFLNESYFSHWINTDKFELRVELKVYENMQI